MMQAEDSIASQQLTHIQTKLAALQAGQIHTTELTDAARAASGLLSSLPPQFEQVLNNILDRLESSALFTEESCSFSQSGLLENLGVWIEKAQLRMNAPTE
jgi:hypothetical protein